MRWVTVSSLTFWLAISAGCGRFGFGETPGPEDGSAADAQGNHNAHGAVPGSGCSPGACGVATAVLDDFNRADGPIGGRWSGSNTTPYVVRNQSLTITTAGFSGPPMAWNQSFPADQEAFVTVTKWKGDVILVLALKIQPPLNALSYKSAIEVVYAESSDRPSVKVDLITDDRGITLQSAFTAHFNDGDRLHAVARSDGRVEVYRNDALEIVADASNWPYTSANGFIGMYWQGGDVLGFIVDDFGGGSLLR